MFLRCLIATAFALTLRSASNGVEFEVARVADINPGPADSNPSDFFELNNELVFKTSLGLAKTDGHTVTMISDSLVLGSPVVEYHGELYFSDPFQLRKTNGMSVIALDGPIMDETSVFHQFEDELYYSGSPTINNGLYRTDGINVTTVSDVMPTSGLIEFAGHLYFESRDYQNIANSHRGHQVFRTDGETATNLNALGSDEYTALIGVYHDELYLANETTLFKTDGESIIEVAALGIAGYPGGDGVFGASVPRSAVFDDEFYFTLQVDYWDGVQGQVLKTDGSTVSSVALGFPVAVGEGGPWFYGDIVPLDEQLVIPVGRSDDVRLFRTDGVILSEVASSNPGNGYAFPTAFTVLGDELFFIAGDSTTTELDLAVYKTDGELITRVSESLGAGYGQPDGRSGPLTTFHGNLFFASEVDGRTVLTATDGSSVIHFLTDRDGNGLEFGRRLGQFGDRLFFSAKGPDGFELYAISVVPEPACLPSLLISAWTAIWAFGTRVGGRTRG